MKKALIALSVLLVVLAILFIGIPSKEKHATKAKKITRKIPLSTNPQKPLKYAKKNIRIKPGVSDKISAQKQACLIQIGTFTNFRLVLDKVLHLKSRGYHVFYSCETVKDNKTLYRVFVECLRSPKEADAMAGELKALGLITDYVIKPVNAKNQTEFSDCEFGSNIYLLHVSSLKQKKNAEKTVQMLKIYGYRSIFIAQEVLGERWFRVYIGEFDDDNEARAVGKGLHTKGLISYYKPIPHDQIIGSPLRDVATAIQQVDESSPNDKFDLPTSKGTQEIIQPKHSKKRSKAVIRKSESLLIIDDITFQIKKGVKEIVLIHANRFFAPSLRLAPEKAKPKIVIDIKKPAVFKPDKMVITANGEWIKTVQIQPAADQSTLTIVLNLRAYHDYSVSQTFYEPQGIYAVKVTVAPKPV